MRSPTEKIAYYGIIGALTILLSAMESVLMPELPFLPPGAKPGLANIIVMLTACTGSIVSVLYTVVLKSLFVFITRGASAFVMSLAGGILSAAVMMLMLKIKIREVSIAGISVTAAVAHNMGQLTAAVILTGSPMPSVYAAALMLFGIVSGLLTGIMTEIILPKLDMAVKKLHSSEGV